MADSAMTDQLQDSIEDVLRVELARGDAVIATARPVLRHLLANDDQTLFSDEIIARIRGMMLDLARQLLFALAEASGQPGRGEFSHGRQAALAQAFCTDTAFLSHAHILTIEARLAESLQARSGIDAVLSPLLQEEAASPDRQRAAAAMGVLAAQARFVQQLRRMEMPLRDLPGELVHKALSILQSFVGSGQREEAEDAVIALRGGYDEAASRLGLIARLVAGLGASAPRALSVDHAGVSIFATALSLASMQDRDMTILSFADRQPVRLALELRAAGLDRDAMAAQFQTLHPGLGLPGGLAELWPEQAAQLLAEAGGRGG